MITAEEAKQRVAESEAAIKTELVKIDFVIREQCDKGTCFTLYDLPGEEFIGPIKNRLNAIGFQVEKIHNSGIQISW